MSSLKVTVKSGNKITIKYPGPQGPAGAGGGGGGSGSGDVVGPASSVSGNLPAFSGNTGKALSDSGQSPATLKDRANHTGAQAISTVTGLQTALDGKETLGAASAAIAAHVAAADPHPAYALDTDLTPKANLASPTFTGTPSAPTAAADNNTAQIATTAFVQQEISNDTTRALASHQHNASDINAGTLAVARGGTGLGTTPANGQIPIGNGSGFSLANLTAGTNITISNSAGGITINAAGGGGGSPGGSSGDIQMNNAGAFGAATGLTYVTGSQTLTAGTGGIATPTLKISTVPNPAAPGPMKTFALGLASAAGVVGYSQYVPIPSLRRVSFAQANGSSSVPSNFGELFSENGTGSLVASTSTTPAYRNYATAATINSTAGYNTSANNSWMTGRNIHFRARFKLNESTLLRAIVGVSSASLLNVTGSDSGSGYTVALMANPASTNFKWITRDNATTTTTDTGIPFDTADHTIELWEDVANSRWWASLDGSTPVALTANIPPANNLVGPVVGIQTLEAVAKNIRFAALMADLDF